MRKISTCLPGCLLVALFFLWMPSAGARIPKPIRYIMLPIMIPLVATTQTFYKIRDHEKGWSYFQEGVLMIDSWLHYEEGDEDL